MTRLAHRTDFTANISQGGFQCHVGRHDDGTEWVQYNDVVCIKLNDGREFFLPNGHVEWVKPEDDAPYQTVLKQYVPSVMLEKVILKGVDIDHWLPIDQSSLEEILSDELYREDEERFYGGY